MGAWADGEGRGGQKANGLLKRKKNICYYNKKYNYLQPCKTSTISNNNNIIISFNVLVIT